MTDVPKKFKKLLIINAIVGFSFAFFYLVAPYYYLSLVEWPFFDPYYSWAFGGTFLILSSFLLRSIKRNRWEDCKPFLEITIAWQILILILNIVSLIFIPTLLISIITTWIYNIMFIILIGVNISFSGRT